MKYFKTLAGYALLVVPENGDHHHYIEWTISGKEIIHQHRKPDWKRVKDVGEAKTFIDEIKFFESIDRQRAYTKGLAQVGIVVPNVLFGSATEKNLIADSMCVVM